MVAFAVGEQFINHCVVLQRKCKAGERREDVRAVGADTRHRLQLCDRLARVARKHPQNARLLLPPATSDYKSNEFSASYLVVIHLIIKIRIMQNMVKKKYTGAEAARTPR